LNKSLTGVLLLFLFSSFSTFAVIYGDDDRKTFSYEHFTNESCQMLGFDCFSLQYKTCVNDGQLRPLSDSLIDDIKQVMGLADEKEVVEVIYPKLLKAFDEEMAIDPSSLDNGRAYNVIAFQCINTFVEQHL
jgi:hypothetical protein